VTEPFPLRSADQSAVEKELRIEGGIFDGGCGSRNDVTGAKGKIAVLNLKSTFSTEMTVL
jgi:aminopeptidase YwaD